MALDRHHYPIAAGARRQGRRLRLRYDENLTTERPTFVTHLECACTGERYAADEIHNLSRAGKPLLVRYDLDGVKKALSKEALAQPPARSVALSRTVAGAPRGRHRQPRRSDDADAAAAEARGKTRRRRTVGQGRRPAADRLVQGARPGHGGVDGQGVRHQTHGDADQRQCRRGAGGLCQPLPASRPRSSVRRTRRR